MAEEDHREGYRTAFKSTAIFGGVQALTMLISVAKNKLMALWLGATGVGIMSLFVSTADMIASITNLGLQGSAIRDIARAEGEGNPTQAAKTIKAVKRCVLGTGLLGAFVTIALSPLLSRWAFESGGYTLSFILLSSMLLMMAIYNGNYAILQGTRNIKFMARANIFGALAGFVCSVPMYYFFREQGIVWALVLTALATLLVSFFYVRKVALPRVEQTLRESYMIGRSTIRLGIMMALGGVSESLVQYLVRIFISHAGGIDGVDDVGFYSAGWTINAQYLGLILVSMSKDFFPRLSAIAPDNGAVSRTVNHQSEIVVLILAPLIIGMIIFLPLIIRLLYTVEFIAIAPMTRLLLFGSLIKAGAWAISFVFLAKGDGKVYLFNELVVKLVTLPSYVLGYYFLGLEGIGYAYVFSHAVYMALVLTVCRRRYKISYLREYWKLFLFMLTLLAVYLAAARFMTDGLVKIVVSLAVMSVIVGYSLYEFNKRVNIKHMLHSFRRRR